MAIALDVSGEDHVAHNPLSVTLNHASGVYIVAVCVARSGFAATPTCGGVAMDLLFNKAWAGDGTDTYAIYGIFRANAANEAIAFTAVGVGRGLAVASFTGVADTSPYFECLNSSNGNSLTPTTTVTAGTTGRWVLQCPAHANGPVAPGAGQTEIVEAGGYPEINYYIISTAVSMSVTAAGAGLWDSVAFALLPFGNVRPITIGQHGSRPIYEEPRIYAWLKDYVFPDVTYARLTFRKNAEGNNFILRTADPDNELAYYCPVSDLKAGILNTIGCHIYAGDRIQFGLFGLVEATSSLMTPRGREFEVSGRQFGHALADASSNGTAYTSRSINDIISNSTDGLMTSITECGKAGVQAVGTTTTYNPSAATNITTSLNYMLGMATTSTAQYTWYFCNGACAGETKRNELHFEQKSRNLSPYELNLKDLIDRADSPTGVSWEDQHTGEVTVDMRFEVGKAITQYGTAFNTQTVGSARPTKFNQLAWTSTSAEATNYGTALTALRNKPLQYAILRIYGTLRYGPGENVHYRDGGTVRTLTLDAVSQTFYPGGWVTDLEVSGKYE